MSTTSSTRPPLQAGALPAAAAALGVILSFVWPGRGAVVVAGLCGLVLAFSSPWLALVVLAFLAPFDDYISAAVIYRDFLVVDLVGLALIAGQLARRSRFPPNAGGLVLGLAALALFCALNVVSLNRSNWADALDNIARLLYLTVLVGAIGTASPRVPLRHVAAALVAGMCVRFLYEARFYFADPSFTLHYSYQFGSMTSNANTLGGFGACVLPLSCSLLLGASKPTRLVAAAATLVLAAGILLTYSKGAWLTAGLALFVFTADLARRRWLDRRMLTALALAGVLATAVVPQARRLAGLVVDRWTSQASVISNRERVRYLTTAGAFIQNHPIRGVGLERFGPAYLKAHQLLRGPDDPHNGYLMVAVELGVPALGCFLFIWFTALITALRNSNVPFGDAAARVAVVASVVAVFVLQLFSAEPLSSRVCWLILAIALTPPLRIDGSVA